MSLKPNKNLWIFITLNLILILLIFSFYKYIHPNHSGFIFGLVEIILFSMYGIYLLESYRRFRVINLEEKFLCAENITTIEELNEGVISVDKDYKITTLNKASREFFDLTKKDYGKRIFDVLPEIDLKSTLEHKEKSYNKIKVFKNNKLLVSKFPLLKGDNVIGATVLFRSSLEVDSLQGQVEGYHKIANALRSQKHEFQNKLHVLLGLIKIKEYKKAEDYIMQKVYKTNLASDYYTSRINDGRVLALFVGKEIQCKEYNINLLLTADSSLSEMHTPIDSDDIVLLLGNLIDNAFEAYLDNEREDNIVVDLFDDETSLKITVIDHAGGIDPSIKNRIFHRGVSSKNGNSRGTGLSLVKEVIYFYNGDVKIETDELGTKFEIVLNKEKK
ncbi:MAG: GHKL domain-containing protein [Candidatus Izimaplasma sp.]|nr:GHKL domain-containing protein [Candidatus Izimaplasma bacterium]